VIPSHAKAVLDRDAEAMCAASYRFEEIGALLFASAGDCRTVEAAAVANRLAAEYGGIRTPALQLMAHLPR
jgi:hypothetical protein